jgi:hypothetical protein
MHDDDNHRFDDFRVVAPGMRMRPTSLAAQRDYGGFCQEIDRLTRLLA